MDWNSIKHEYLQEDTSYRALSEKYGIAYSKLWYRANAENWDEEKNAKPADPLLRIKKAADKLLDRIEQAADELDLYLTKNKVKTKSIAYLEDSGKVEEEVICEEEAIGTGKGMVDRTELKQLVATLKDIKDIYSAGSDASFGQLEALIKGLKEDE